MSLHRACCCGEPEGCSVCSCASSYRVSGINLSYSFSLNKATAGEGCTCRYIEYDIFVSINPAQRVVVSKVSGGSCCYRGTFDVEVSGYVNLRQYYDSGSYCPPTINYSQTYNFSRTTCACLTVACNSKVDECNGQTRTGILVHTIEIGDFVVDCNATILTAGDCDSCPEQGSSALRCLGGRFQYSSDVGCLNNLTGVKFNGFHGPSQQLCGSGGPPSNPGGCFANLEASIANVGPFAVIAEEECSEGQDDEDCIDPPAVGYTDFATYRSGWPETLRNDLQGPCGGTDFSGRLFLNSVCFDEYDVLQSAAPGFWAYL